MSSFRYLLTVACLCTAISGCGIEEGGSVVAEEPPPLVVKGIEGDVSVRRFSARSNTLTVGNKQLDVLSPTLMITIDDQGALLQHLRVGDQVK